MTEKMQQVLNLLSNFPEARQDEIADWIREEMDSDGRWSELYQRTESDLASLAAEAQEEYTTGETEELDADQL